MAITSVGSLLAVLAGFLHDLTRLAMTPSVLTALGPGFTASTVTLKQAA